MGHTHSEMKALTVLLLSLLVLTVTSRRDSFDDNKPFNKNNPRMATENCNIRGQEDTSAAGQTELPGTSSSCSPPTCWAWGWLWPCTRWSATRKSRAGVLCLTCEEMC